MNFEHLPITDSDGNYHVADPATCRVASRLYELWPRLLRVYMPRDMKIASRDAIAFYRAAVLCMERKLTPEAYLSQILVGMSKTGCFYTRLISSPKVLDLGHEDPKVRRKRWLDLYSSQLQLYETRYPIFGHRDLLLDDTVPFTPLFRCVMSTVSGVMNDVFPRYLDAARIELQAVDVAKEIFNKELLEHIG